MTGQLGAVVFVVVLPVVCAVYAFLALRLVDWWFDRKDRRR